MDFTSISAAHVGRYYCIYKYYVDTDKTNYDDEVKKFKASTIYVFVNGSYEVDLQFDGSELHLTAFLLFNLDPDNLLFDPNGEYMIMGKQFEPFVIPCKPSSPDVRVELTNEHGEVMEFPYDIYKGFTVVFNETLEYGVLDCKLWLEQEGEKYSETEKGFIIEVKSEKLKFQKSDIL